MALDNWDPRVFFFFYVGKAWHWEYSLYDPKYPFSGIPTTEEDLEDRQGAQPTGWHGDPWEE